MFLSKALSQSAHYYSQPLQHHLKELKLPFNIPQDEKFCHSREVFATKRKNLVTQGHGDKPTACRKLTTEEEEKSFESGKFGCHNPKGLQRTLWWFFSLNFGFQARDESQKLCWGNLELQNDPQTGKEVLVWMAERGSKTRKGMQGAHKGQFNPQIFTTGTESCPVGFLNVLKATAQKRQRLQVIHFSLP